MRNSSGALVSTIEPQSSHGPGGDGSEEEARPTLVAPPPDWMRRFDSNEAPSNADPSLNDSEDQFWNEPPRYSVDNLLSLAPLPLKAAPSRLRRWGAKLLFAAVFCAVSTLLGFETLSAVHAGDSARVISGAREELSSTSSAKSSSRFEIIRQGFPKFLR
jgi:hypothetical protein